jgi:phenylacetate-CoA ligase
MRLRTKKLLRLNMLNSLFSSPFQRVLFENMAHTLNGSPRLRYWKKLEKTQFLSEKELLNVQWQRLTELLRFSWDNNDFYRRRFQKAGLTPDSIRSPLDFRRLDMLTKEEIRSNSSSMISQGFRVEDLHKFKTGGSTGKALDIYITEECSCLRNACTLRHDLWSGWKRGEPVAAIWGNPYFPRTIKEKLRNFIFLPPTIYLDTMDVSSDSITKFVEQWRRVMPTLIFGHAHSIFILAQSLEKIGATDLHPKGIISTSMMLLPHERRKIEEVFSVAVTDRYGCEEVSLIGCECEKHEGMHLNVEHLFIEFLNNEGVPVAPGQPGKIVVTDLMNRAMPLIRYQVDDVGVPSDRKCSCGRGLPLMEHVTGRVADFLVKKDGSRVAGVSLIENTLTSIPGINQMQVVQESLELILLRVVPGALFDVSAKSRLTSYFHSIFGAEISIQVSKVTEIAPEPSGKFRFSICKIPQL